jgi:hypothetical protein
VISQHNENVSSSGAQPAESPRVTFDDEFKTSTHETLASRIAKKKIHAANA